MAKSIYSHMKAVIATLLILALAVTCTMSSRILDEEVVTPSPTIASQPDIDDTTETPPAAETTLGATINPPTTATPAPKVGGVIDAENPNHALTFFMHDILGGSNPSAIAVTGIVANPIVGGQVPFAKPNGAVLPIGNSGGGDNSGVLNNNNVPFLTGLSGYMNNIGQNSGNSIIGGGFGLPTINLAQFPTGTTFQKLMFGTMTVFDDELTEGHELGSGLVGKSQGFYISSSQDGTSQTMAFNVMLHENGYVDSLCLFGVHRSAASESHLAIMGGTGKFVNAQGFATVKTFPASPHQQQLTDGMETVLKITVYLDY